LYFHTDAPKPQWLTRRPTPDDFDGLFIVGSCTKCCHEEEYKIRQFYLPYNLKTCITEYIFQSVWQMKWDNRITPPPIGICDL